MRPRRCRRKCRVEWRHSLESYLPLRSFDVRAYRVTNEKLFNKTIAELEAMPQEVRVFIQRIRREGAIIEPEPQTVIRQGDVIAVMARPEVLVERSSVVGPEIDDKELLDFPVEVLDVVMTNKVSRR